MAHQYFLIYHYHLIRTVHPSQHAPMDAKIIIIVLFMDINSFERVPATCFFVVRSFTSMPSSVSSVMDSAPATPEYKTFAIVFKEARVN